MSSTPHLGHGPLIANHAGDGPDAIITYVPGRPAGDSHARLCCCGEPSIAHMSWVGLRGCLFHEPGAPAALHAASRTYGTCAGRDGRGVRIVRSELLRALLTLAVIAACYVGALIAGGA